MKNKILFMQVIAGFPSFNNHAYKSNLTNCAHWHGISTLYLEWVCDTPGQMFYVIPVNEGQHLTCFREHGNDIRWVTLERVAELEHKGSEREALVLLCFPPDPPRGAVHTCAALPLQGEAEAGFHSTRQGSWLPPTLISTLPCTPHPDLKVPQSGWPAHSIQYY